MEGLHNVPQSEYILIPSDYANRNILIDGSAIILIIGGPPKSDEVSFKPGFGGIMFGSNDDQLIELQSK